MPKQIAPIVIEQITSEDNEVFSKVMEWYRQLIAITFYVPIELLWKSEKCQNKPHSK